LRAQRVVAGFEQTESFFRAIEQPRLQKVLPQFVQRVIALANRKVGPAQQILMHADRAVRFAAATEQIAQREMQFDRFRVELDHFDKRVNRLVRLFVEQKIQSADIRTRQVGALGQQRLEVVARSHPAERERDGYDEQPPEV
jgi:hypothetical protein